MKAPLPAGMTDTPEVREKLQAALGVPGEPMVYAYRYRDGIRFDTGGRVINGSRPTEAIALYPASIIAAALAERDKWKSAFQNEVEFHRHANERATVAEDKIAMAANALALAANRLARCAVEVPISSSQSYEWNEWAGAARAAYLASSKREAAK